MMRSPEQSQRSAIHAKRWELMTSLSPFAMRSLTDASSGAGLIQEKFFQCVRLRASRRRSQSVS
jgi:hypothetical protein